MSLDGEKLALAQIEATFDGISDLIEKVFGSKAAVAVVELAKAGVDVALFKHKRRGDSWIDELPEKACVTLSKAKCARVSLLFDALAAGTMTQAEAFEEFIDESMDVVIYMAFARWHVEHGNSILTK